MSGGLSPKQAAFVAEYLIDLNATRAAIRAGYSERTAGWTGCRLLRNAAVREAVEREQARRAERTGITADRVLAELANIAFADPRDLMEWGPDGVTLKDSASLAEVAEGSGGTLRLKKHDKVKALELLARHIGMFRDRVETEVSGGVTLTWRK